MGTVIIEHTLNAPVELVWDALTNVEKMRKWYFDLAEFKAEPGFEFGFAGHGHKGEKYMHVCKVTEVIPHKKLQYSWQYEDRGGYSLVTFELTGEGNKTRLKLTHSGLETFPQGHPDFAFESFNDGWTELITKQLSAFLANAS